MAPQRDPLDLDSWWHPLAQRPWWLWVLAAVAAALVLHWLAELGRTPGLADADGWYLVRALAGFGQWLVPGVLLLQAGVSSYRTWHGHRLHQTLAANPRTLDLADLGWGDFGLLVAEVFRARGYRVDEPAQVPTSGGHHLFLDGVDGRAVVLCRHWHAWRVGAAEVQELIAAMEAKGAGRGILVIPGEFTRDARRLADGRPIELIDGTGLKALAQGPGLTPPQTVQAGRGRRWRWPFKRPRPPIPLGPVLHLVAILAVAGALYGGFQWVLSLPDKRLPQPQVSQPLAAVDPGPVFLVSEPAQALAPSPPPSPPQPPAGLGGFRSVQELEAAFESFYVPPPGCASPASRADMVECANHRIRARQGFMVAGTAVEPESEVGHDVQSEYLVEAIPTDDPAWYDPAVIEALAPPGSPVHGSERADPASESELWESVPPEARVTPPAPAPANRDPASTYVPYDPLAPWPGR